MKLTRLELMSLPIAIERYEFLQRVSEEEVPYTWSVLQDVTAPDNEGYVLHPFFKIELRNDRAYVKLSPLGKKLMEAAGEVRGVIEII